MRRVGGPRGVPLLRMDERMWTWKEEPFYNCLSKAANGILHLCELRLERRP